MTVDLTFSCGQYATTNPLIEGAVQPEGVSLTAVATGASPPERFTRMVQHREFDISEMSLGSYLSSLSEPEKYPFTAIPIFPDRIFRHSYMLKHTKADISDPGDFEGGKVGLISWQATAGIWMRGIAAEHYDLDLNSVTWVVRGGMPVDSALPDWADVQPAPEGTDPHEMLANGELDGLMSPEVPDFGREGVEQVFDDPIAVETEYYRDTGIFPIMHTVVVRDELLDDYPWLGPTLYQAFCESRDVGLERFEDPDRAPLVWSFQYQRDEHEVFEETPWTHGLTESNRDALNALIRYAHQLELVPEQYDPEELFTPNTVNQNYLGH